MFCPSCGFEYTQKTNYCKRCGEDLNPAGGADAPKKTQSNVAIMFIAVVAFCLSAMTLILLAYDHFFNRGWSESDASLINFVILFSFVVALLLIWQLARMVTAFRRTRQDKIIEKHFIREVPAIQPVAPTGQIPAPAGPPSVVEHTTRQMAGAYNDPEATN